MRFALIAAVLLLAPTAQARPVPGWLRFGSLSGPARATFPALAPARRAELAREQHPHVDRLYRIELALRADGRVEERALMVRDLLSEEGVRRAGTVSLYARNTTDELVVEEAYALSPHGRTSFQPKLAQVMTTSARDLFSDTQEIVLPFTGLAADSTLVVATRRLTDRRKWPLPWSHIVTTRAGAPLEALEVTVTWDAGVPAPIWRSNASALTCDEQPRRLTCRQGPVAPPVPDPEVASWADLVPHFVVGMPQSWGELAARERSILEPGVPHPAVARRARELTSAGGSPRDRLVRLFRFVAKEIRYVGLEQGHGAVVPRPPTLTLERRFGDCKDKVALLVAMARAVGLEAEPLLVATDRRDPAALLVPSWKYFDHVIACVKWADGHACVDPTDPDLPVGELGFLTRSAVILPLGPNALPTVMKTDEPAWRIAVESKNVVGCDGSVREEVKRSYFGPGAGVFRAQLRRPLADQKRWLEDGYTAVMGEQGKPSVTLDGLDDSESPLVLSSEAKYPATAALAQQTRYAEPDHWLRAIAKDFRTGNKHHPYATGGLALTSSVSYVLCDKVLVGSLGPTLELESRFGVLARRYRKTGDTVVVETRLFLPPQTVAAKALADFNRFIDVAVDQSDIRFELRAKGAP